MRLYNISKLVGGVCATFAAASFLHAEYLSITPDSRRALTWTGEITANPFRRVAANAAQSSSDSEEMKGVSLELRVSSLITKHIGAVIPTANEPQVIIKNGVFTLNEELTEVNESGEVVGLLSGARIWLLRIEEKALVFGVVTDSVQTAPVFPVEVTVPLNDFFILK